MTNTPLFKLADFYIKREDLNLTGSAKDRAISNQIKHLKSRNIAKAVISSTGNAAISASYYCHQNKIHLTVFVSPSINPQKLKLIDSSNLSLFKTDRPISSAFKFAKTTGAYFLRQSTDPWAISGYKTIGQEIVSQLPRTTSIFVPVGSGTTLWGISRGISKNLPIFAIQSAANPYLAKIFDSHFTPETNNLTDSLTAKFSPLKNKIVTRLKQAGGGYVIQNDQLKVCFLFLKKHKLVTSYESALGLAGLFKARQSINPGQYPVIIFTGAKR